MKYDAPSPTDKIEDDGYGAMFAHLCSRPSMYVAGATFDAVAAYINGFDRARGHSPLLGFREWLVVRANTGNNLVWEGLVIHLSPVPTTLAPEEKDRFLITAAGELIAEYLAHRNAVGITKVYYDYARWLLRKKWYQGPLRKRD